MFNQNFKEMKKINKLEISSEKIMKNEELINLQGGYQGWCCYCEGISILAGPSSMAECQDQCDMLYGVTGWWSDQC